MGCTGRNPVVPRAAAAARAWVVQQQRPVLRSSSGGGRSGVSGEGSGHYASTEHGWPAFSLICCLSLGSPPTGSWHTQSTHWINVRKGAGGSLPPPACRVPPEAVGTQLPIDSPIDGPSNDVNVLPAPRRVRVASSCKLRHRCPAGSHSPQAALPRLLTVNSHSHSPRSLLTGHCKLWKGAPEPAVFAHQQGFFQAALAPRPCSCVGVDHRPGETQRSEPSMWPPACCRRLAAAAATGLACRLTRPANLRCSCCAAS